MTDKERILRAIKDHDGWGIYELSVNLNLDMCIVSDLTRELLAEKRIKHCIDPYPITEEMCKKLAEMSKDFVDLPCDDDKDDDDDL